MDHRFTEMNEKMERMEQRMDSMDEKLERVADKCDNTRDELHSQRRVITGIESDINQIFRRIEKLEDHTQI